MKKKIKNKKEKLISEKNKEDKKLLKKENKKNNISKNKVIKFKSKTKSFYSSSLPIIKVVGVGGGGGNAVSRMSRNFMRGVEFIAINTDHQDLDHCNVRKKLYIGKSLTRGLGTGMNPELGRQAAEENRSEIEDALKGSDIVFLAAGLGGGTGSGASPVVAEIARQNGAITLAFVTKPFSFEGSQRAFIADEALMRLKDKVDALVVISNDKIFSLINKDISILKAFAAIDEVLKNAILGIVEIIAVPGIINLDFADIKSVIQDAGTAVVGVGIASGQNRAALAVESALNSPLLEFSAEGAKGIVFSVAGTKDMKMAEIYEAAQKISEIADPSAKIIFGTYYDKNLKPGQLKITLIATGLNGGASSTVSLFGGSISRQSFKFDFENFKKDNISKIEEIEEKTSPLRFNFYKNINVDKKNIKQESNNLKTDEKVNLDNKLINDKENQDKNLQNKDLIDSDSNNEDLWDTPAFLRRKKKQ
ncbi:MAG: cell division protein FtsZ [Patescibacteria group bacterium]|nr:cell division protein FtsZ [Patescibacteria group bacterium]MCX7589942.1 cell division protein FtsZ [Patescibacteria group bacterium]MDW8279780.1 cell division protein FtsZ [bacterium]